MSRIYRSGIHSEGVLVSGTPTTVKIPLQVGKNKCARIKRVDMSLNPLGFSDGQEVAMAIVTQSSGLDFGAFAANEAMIASSSYTICASLWGKIQATTNIGILEFKYEIHGDGFEVVNDIEFWIDSGGNINHDVFIQVYYEICKINFAKWAEIAADTVKMLHRVSKQGGKRQT